MASDSSTNAGAGPQGTSQKPAPSPEPQNGKARSAILRLFMSFVVFLVVFGGLWCWLTVHRHAQWGMQKTVYYSILVFEAILLVWLFFEIYVVDVFSSPPTTPGPETDEDRRRTRVWATARYTRRKWLKRFFTGVFMAILVTLWVEAVRRNFSAWGWGKTLFFSIPFVAAVALVVLFHKVMRAQDAVMEEWFESNPDDPNCDNILVVFNLSPKVLYFMTILASLVMALLIHLKEAYGLMPGLNMGLLGGIWLAIFFLNFLVEEYNVDLMAVLVGLSIILATVVWVAYMGWMQEFIDFFKNFGVRIDATGYLLIAGIFALAILYSIIKGAFYYVAITPNDLNMQTGITESGQQINREAFNTTVDAGDLMERMWGFGRIIISFRDPHLKPIEMLVWNIKGKAKKLEAIRATYVVDNQQRTRM